MMVADPCKIGLLTCKIAMVGLLSAWCMMVPPQRNVVSGGEDPLRRSYLREQVWSICFSARLRRSLGRLNVSAAELMAIEVDWKRVVIPESIPRELVRRSWLEVQPLWDIYRPECRQGQKTCGLQ